MESQTHIKMKSFLVLVLGLSVMYNVQARIVYVHNGVSNGDGSSWARAGNDLRVALDTASSDDTLWITEGTYYPTNGTDRLKHFLLKEGVTMLGGFPKGATSLGQRNWKKYRTILSADIGKKADSLDNSYNILWTADKAIGRAFAWIDGLEFRYGQADSLAISGSKRGMGGAIFVSRTGPALSASNCLFYKNYCTGSGGAVNSWKSKCIYRDCEFSFNKSASSGAVTSSQCSFYDCLFKGNSSSSQIGALNAYWSDIINCRFIDNSTASLGGALYVGNSNIINCYFENNHTKGFIWTTNGGAICLHNNVDWMRIVGCNFQNNSASGRGGAIYVNSYMWPSVKDSILVCRSTFNNNQSGWSGGAIYMNGSTSLITNSAFMNNKSRDHGSAIWQGNLHRKPRILYKNCSFYGHKSDSNSTIYFNNLGDTTDAPLLINCILNGNDSNSLKTPMVSQNPLHNIRLRRCLIDFNYAASDTIRSKPLFVKPNGADGKRGTPDDHLRLNPSSRAINNGIDSTIFGICDNTFDVEGNPRIVDSIDIGAYERVECNSLRSPRIVTSTLEICLGDSFIVTDSLPETGAMTWHSSEGINIPQTYLYDSVVHILASKVGTVKVWRTARLCSTSVADTLTFLVRQKTSIRAIEPSSSAPFCEGDTMVIKTAFPHMQFEWGNGDKTDSIAVYTNVKVHLRTKDSNKCWSDTAFYQVVAFQQLPAKPTIKSSISKACSGDSVYLSVDTDSVAYNWTNGMNKKAFYTTTQGPYSVRVIDSNGCKSVWSDTALVHFWPFLAKPMVVYDTLLACKGDTLWLRPNSTYSLLAWQSGHNALSVPMVTNGLNFYRYRDTNGCWSPNSDTVNAIFRSRPIPEILFDEPAAFCQGDSMVLKATPIVGGNHYWSTNDTGDSVVVNTEQWVYLWVEDAYCASDVNDSVFVEQWPNPDIPRFTTTHDSICEGDTVILRIVNPETYIYRWSDGSTGNIRQITTNISLAVLAENTYGCRSHLSSSLNLILKPSPEKPLLEITKGKSTLCKGDSCTLATIQGFSKYYWNDVPSSLASTTIKAAGNYKVQVKGANGCMSPVSNVIAISVVQVPVVRIDSIGELSFCYGDSVKLSILPEFDQYSWSDGSAAKNRTFLESNTLWVWGIFNGCPSDSQQVTILEYAALDTPSIDHRLTDDKCKPTYKLSISDDGTKYEWNLLEGKEKTLTTSTPGEYMVRYTNQYDCWSAWSNSHSISTLSFTSLNDVEFSLSPNPTTGIINLSSNGPVKSNGVIQIAAYDAIGRIVLTEEMGMLECKPLIEQFDFSALSSGQYFLRISDEEHTKLIVVLML